MFKKNLPYIIIATIIVILCGILKIKDKNIILTKNNSNFVTQIDLNNLDNQDNDYTIIENQIEPVQSENPLATPNLGSITIYISGEVQKSGVYTVPMGSRINDVLIKAGGFSKEADTNGINLAKLVMDEEHIIVPKLGQQLTTNSIASQYENNKININTGTKEDLMTLSGIGTVTADNIIEYRIKNGDYKNIEDIQNVKRIGNSIYNEIKDNITVK